MKIKTFGALPPIWSKLEEGNVPLEPREYRVGMNARTFGGGLTIRAGSNGWRNGIHELKDGRFAYVVSAFIRRDLPGKTMIREIWLGLPWIETNFEWLEDSRNEEKHPGYYTFRHDTERFMREEVLSHKLPLVLSCGDVCEGYLLGTGLRPPDTYNHRENIPVVLNVRDQWDREHSTILGIRLNRLASRTETPRKHTHVPLLSKKDELPHHKQSRPVSEKDVQRTTARMSSKWEPSEDEKVSSATHTGKKNELS